MVGWRGAGVAGQRWIAAGVAVACTICDLPPTAQELKQARQQALSVLTTDLQRGSSDTRHAAVEAAGWTREPSLREPLEALLGSQDATLSTHVAEALSKLGEPQAAPRLRAQLQHQAPGLDWQRARLASAYALSKLGDAEGREVLRSALQGSPSSAAGLGLAQDARAPERIAAALLLCDSDEAEAQSLLSQIVAEPRTPFSTVLEILSCQARGSQSPAALQALRSRLRASQGKDRLAVAARLAALGDCAAS